MSLILAIEPNKNQAHQLSALVRAHLKAELVTAPTAAAALSALGDRIPDVVLTPALFGLRDEAALTERLRQLGSDAAHVQTLAIPILAAASAQRGGANGGLLGRKKDKADSNVGCDPAVFAEQIRIYLQRASVERRAQASEAAARAMATTRSAASNEPAEQAEDLSAFMVSADELDVDSLSIDLPVPSAPAAPPPQPHKTAVSAPPVDDAHPRNKKSNQKSPSPVEEELGLVTPPASGPPLWRVAESVDDYYGKGDAIANAVSTADMSVEPFPNAPEASPRSAAHHAAPAVPRPRRTPPQPDDWAYFDPSQSTFKALIRKLDEIAGSAA